MNDLNNKKTVSLEVLEEVFNEIDSLENLAAEKSDKEDSSTSIFKFEEELANGDIIFNKNKKSGNVDDLLKMTKDETVVHEGLTDSSDDEDNKYFEEKKYNECGKTLKSLLEEKAISKSYSKKEGSKTENTWNSQAVKKKLNDALGKFNEHNSDKASLLSDPVFGMRIINPLVSSAELREKMIGRVSISTSKIKHFLESPASKNSNWVTGGVIVSKSVKTSQKGNQYCLWHLTDLTGDIKAITVFLFGSAYKEFWKTSVGTVVGVLNPTVMNGSESKSKSEGTFRIDNSQKILVMGASKDFGLCKSKKKNGENCMSVVNKSKCDFCIYHMKKEYNKACRRSDLQPPKIGRNLESLRAKLLGKNQLCLGGKIFNGVVGKKSAKQIEKDERRLKSLSHRNSSNLSESEQQKTRDLLNRLSKPPNSSKGSKPVEPSSAAKVVEPSLSAKAPFLPTAQPQMIDLGFTVTKKQRNAARANALKYIREHGPLKASSVKGKKTAEQILAVKRKLEDWDENEKKKAKLNDTPTNTLKEKQLKNGITDEFLNLMNSEMRNNDLLRVAEIEEREKYFNKLEMKEKIENKMATTFKVPCKAVRCLKCGYKTFSASDLCKKENHPLKVVDAVKRFWKCKDCSARTVCLELVPLHPCKNCGGSKWEKTSMMREKKDGNLIVEPLSLRGHEEQFLGSMIKNPNLNLLVPDEPFKCHPSLIL